MRSLIAVALVLGLMPRTAESSPLEPLWEVPFTGNCDSSVFALGDELAMLRGDRLVPIDRATGKLGKGRALRMTRPNVQHGRSWATPGTAEVFDRVLVVRGGGWVGGFDPKTGAELWSSDRGNGLQQAEPRQMAVVMEHADPTVQLEVVEPRSGAPRWQIGLRGTSQEFHNLTADAARVYAITTPTTNTRKWLITAVAFATGKIEWTYELDASADGEPRAVASDAGFVVEVPGEGLRVLEPATGKLRKRIATPTVKRFAISGSRVIAALVTRPGDFDAHAIAAYDLVTGSELWRTPLELVSDDLVVDASTVFVRVSDEIHALDVATGVDGATWTMADQDLVFVHDDARAPAVVLCGGGRLVALDPSGRPRASETATIEATIACRGCTRATPAPTEAIVDGTPIPLVRGKLRATVKARGQIHVSATLSDTSAVTAGIRWELRPCDRTIALTGRRRYTFSCVVQVTDNGQ
jgi:outer membrane protein assembly factor BamB